MNDVPLVVHIVFRFDYGGLENGVVNVINGLDGNGTRHAVIALTVATAFRKRLNDGVQVHELHKRPGKDLPSYWRLYRLLRELRPAVVHTRNIGTLDCQFVAFLAGVPVRIHGEHGWDVHDPEGKNRKYRLLRRLLAPFVTRFVTVSDELRQWLIDTVGVDETRVTRICNGVDIDKFRPQRAGDGALPLPPGFVDDSSTVIGSVCRFSAIKDPLNLVEAFINLKKRAAPASANARLVMIGDGELHEAARERLQAAEVDGHAWLPGSRDDVAELLRTMHVFVLGSQREGISNTVLEAMASGLPVIATATGGNLELVSADTTGALVPPGDPGALGEAVGAYLDSPSLLHAHGRAARQRTVDRYSLGGMIDAYDALYRQHVPAIAEAA